MSEKLPFGADYIDTSNYPFESWKEQSRERLDDLDHDFKLRIDTLLRLIQNFSDEIKSLPEYPRLLEIAKELAGTIGQHRAKLEEDDKRHLSHLKKAFDLLPADIKKQVQEELGKK